MEAIKEQSLEAGPTLSDEAFYQFCQRNPDLRFEQEPDGKLTIMPKQEVKPERSILNSITCSFPG